MDRGSSPDLKRPPAKPIPNITESDVRAWLYSNPQSAAAIVRELEPMVKGKPPGCPSPKLNAQYTSSPLVGRCSSGLSVNSPKDINPSQIRSHASSFNLLGPADGVDVKPSPLHSPDVFFEIARTVYSSLNLPTIIERVLSYALLVVKAQRCSVFLLDKERNELYSTAFDLGLVNDPSNSCMALSEAAGEQILVPEMPRSSLPSHQSNSSIEGSRRPLEKGLSDRHIPINGTPTAASSLAPSPVRPIYLKSCSSVFLGSDVDGSESTEEAFPTYMTVKNPEIRFPVGKGIAGIVAETGRGLNIEDAYSDPRFNSETDRMTGFKTNTILCMPIWGTARSPASGKPELLGVASLINKEDPTVPLKPGERWQCFTTQDCDAFRDFLALVGIAVNNAQVYQRMEQKEKEASEMAQSNKKLYETAQTEAKKAKVLLELAQSLYGEDELESLAGKIILHGRDLVGADKASLFIVDEEKQELYSAVFDSQETKSRFAVPINRGISGYVATSGKIMNIKDVYDDPRFNNAIDIKTGYRTKSMLCVPICGPENQKVIGVTTLINKLEMPYFTVEDEEVFMAFSVFCGLAIHKSLLMSSLKNHRNMLSVTMELMSYHVTSKPEEVHAFQASMERQGVQMQFDDLASPLFDAHDYHLNDALVYIMLQMFKDLGYPQKYEISDQKLLTYALTIRRNYRDNAYHNFTHAVAVSHAIYYLAKTGISRKYLEEIEEFSMLLAAFNHDIDHRGTNNAFQKSAHTALADFYSTSTMERHHFNHAMTILNTPHHNIFERLSPNEYQRCLKTFEHGILATDLALYFKNRKPTEALEGCYNKADSQHRELLRGLIMTCSDLSSMTKRWEGSQHTADQVYSEFFEQGDKERALGLPFSSPLMDRSNTSKIPKMQFEFYGAIVAPAFALLAKLVPEVQPLYDSVLANQSRWKVLMDSNVPYEIHQPSH